MKITKKRHKIKECSFPNLQSHLACQYNKMCVLTRTQNGFCECLVKLWVTKHKCRSFLVVLFFRHRAVLPTCSKKLPRKSKIRLHWDQLQNIPNLINIPGLYISWVRTQTMTTMTDRISDELSTDRISELLTERHFLELSETCLYIVHLDTFSYR